MQIWWSYCKLFFSYFFISPSNYFLSLFHSFICTEGQKKEVMKELCSKKAIIGFGRFWIMYEHIEKILALLWLMLFFKFTYVHIFKWYICFSIMMFIYESIFVIYLEILIVFNLILCFIKCYEYISKSAFKPLQGPRYLRWVDSNPTSM